MLLALESDQEFFRETTARFLDEKMAASEIRRIHEDGAGLDEAYWRQGAELGWTSLLVDEANGGGSISGTGLVDLTLVAHEFGRHAAPGPLAGTNVVAATLSEIGGDRHADTLAGLLDGSVVVAWCSTGKRPHQRLGQLPVTIDADGDDLVINGTARPVESADAAARLLVTGRTGDACTQVLIPIDTPGVTVRPMESVDMTRRFSEVTFDGARVSTDTLVGEVGGAGRQVARQLALVLVINTAESVGAMQRGFDMTVEWAFDRYSFGRSLASYQALKHRFADMKTWLESSHAIADAAAAAVAERAPIAEELVSSAKSYIGDKGVDLLQDCVQLHGGIGVSYEHDLHFYLRRHTLNRTLYGSPTEHRQRLAEMVAEGMAA